MNVRGGEVMRATCRGLNEKLNRINRENGPHGETSAYAQAVLLIMIESNFIDQIF